MGDLDGDGRAARVDGQRNTDEERRLAVQHLHKRALYPSDLNRLLWAFGLHTRPAPTKKGEPR